MASDGKEKKRKAASSANPTDPPTKKSKNSLPKDVTDEPKIKKASKAATATGKHAGLPAPTSAPVPGAQVNEAVAQSKKARKRAADFLSDDEGSAKAKKHAVEDTKAAVADTDEKPQKKSRKTKADDKVEILNGSTAPIKVSDATPSTKVADKSKNSRVVEEKPGAATTLKTKTTLEQEKLPKKPKPSAATFHADKLEKLLSTPTSEWPDKRKAKKARKTQDATETLTADGVNGVVEKTGDEKLATITANDKISTSMQAEAQRTQDQEIEEEFGGLGEGDDEGDLGAAILAGFDSDGEDDAEDKDFDLSRPIEMSKAAKKKLKKAGSNEKNEGPGTVYVGRIPHGFYEHQMREYFSQFGTITKLRISRNKRTGRSKHYAFIEFESAEVAQIVAQAMDNYLMFGHILKCKYAPPEALHPDVWKGANKRYRRIPHERLEKAKLEAPKTQSQWEQKIEKEQKKRVANAEKLKAMGYEIELPEMKKPVDVIAQKKLQDEAEQKLLEEPPVAEEPTGAIEPPNGVPKDEIAMEVSKKSKKGKKIKAEKPVEPVSEKKAEDAIALDQGEPEKAKKSRKEKKEKVSVALPVPAAQESEVVVPEPAPTEIAGPAEDKKEKRRRRNSKKNTVSAPPLQSNVGIVSTDVEVKDTPAPPPTAPAETSTVATNTAAGEEAETNGKKHRKRGKKAVGDAVPVGTSVPIEAKPVEASAPVVPAAVDMKEKRPRRRKSDVNGQVEGVSKKAKKAKA